MSGKGIAEIGKAGSLPGIKNTSVQSARSREFRRKPAEPFEHRVMREARRGTCIATSGGGKNLCENTSSSGSSRSMSRKRLGNHDKTLARLEKNAAKPTTCLPNFVRSLSSIASRRKRDRVP